MRSPFLLLSILYYTHILPCSQVYPCFNCNASPNPQNLQETTTGSASGAPTMNYAELLNMVQPFSRLRRQLPLHRGACGRIWNPPLQCDTRNLFVRAPLVSRIASPFLQRGGGPPKVVEGFAVSAKICGKG